MHKRVASSCCLLILATLSASTTAQAHAYATGCFTCNTTWLPIGINLGGLSRWSNDENHGALLLGAEASVLRFGDSHETVHWGAYFDTVYETREAIFRTSAGPEIILVEPFPFGIDLGPLVEWKGLHSNIGLRARFFIPLLFFVPYVGTTYLTAGEQGFVLEGGVLLKVPLLIQEH